MRGKQIIMKILITMISLMLFSIPVFTSGSATIKIKKVNLRTYMFSEPNPVPEIGRIYPYFRFDGYTDIGKYREWNMVVLENNFIKVFVCPEIGGKVWGAIEKSTGKEFLYFNHVVKFRNIGMRGPWTSGGMEFNFGDIGHIPSCATPVNYSISRNPDGSVSCTVGATDFPSGTKWNVKISLSGDEAYFKTRASWFNVTSLPVTYYHWMNASAKAGNNLEFIYPGSKRIGHNGESGKWPYEGKNNISFYKKNNFGKYKSYHVINSYSDYMGGYWHDLDFGFGHLSDYDEKPGKKIWIWGLSDQGMIWEKLLTDNDGQYVEYQSGKLFNQAAPDSTFSPFKHREFLPYDSDIMEEMWFPLKGTKGMVAASKYAVLNVVRNGEKVKLIISALKNIDDNLLVKSVGNKIINEKIKLSPLQLFIKEFKLKKRVDFSVEIGKELLTYSSVKSDLITDRPVKSPVTFDWDSPYGLFTKALELEKQRKFSESMELYQQCIKKENNFLPALGRIALGYYRMTDYIKSLRFAERALSVNTYDPLGNYVFGLVNKKLENMGNAKSGFSIASQSIIYRNSAFTELAKIFLKDNLFNKAEKYALKALSFNSSNVSALEILAIVYRKLNREKDRIGILKLISDLDQTCSFVKFENLLSKTITSDQLKKGISGELPWEFYIDLAVLYNDLGCESEALKALENAPTHPIVCLWKSYLNESMRKKFLRKTLSMSPEFVFPYRDKTAEILEYFIQKNNHWKLKYYLSLILWNKGLANKAKKLFKECGNRPDFYPFYLAKIKLFENDRKIESDSLLRAKKLNGSSWRIDLVLINNLMKKGLFEEAKKIAEKNVKKYPRLSVFGLLYAKILLRSGLNIKCIEFLNKYKVLPYEGATDGRTIYHEACIRAAYAELKKGNYLKVIEYGCKGKLWPVGLGTGKPYEVDERMDDFLIAYGYEKLGKYKLAAKYYKKVSDHKSSRFLKENPFIYLQVIVLLKNGKRSESRNLVKSAVRKNPENIYFEWIKDLFVNRNREKREFSFSDWKIIVTKKNFDNKNFRLVMDLFNIIGKKRQGNIGYEKKD